MLVVESECSSKRGWRGEGVEHQFCRSWWFLMIGCIVLCTLHSPIDSRWTPHIPHNSINSRWSPCGVKLPQSSSRTGEPGADLELDRVRS